MGDGERRKHVEKRRQGGLEDSWEGHKMISTALKCNG